MSFVIRMALREIRASWQRLLFFFVCIAVGVASIVAIRSVIQSVRQGLTREARAMTGADVVVRSDRPLGRRDSRRGGARTRRVAVSSIVSEAVEIATMVRPADRRRRLGWWNCAPWSDVSALRHDDAAGEGVLARAAARPRRRSSAPNCWRSSTARRRRPAHRHAGVSRFAA